MNGFYTPTDLSIYSLWKDKKFNFESYIRVSIIQKLFWLMQYSYVSVKKKDEYHYLFIHEKKKHFHMIVTASYSSTLPSCKGVHPKKERILYKR